MSLFRRYLPVVGGSFFGLEFQADGLTLQIVLKTPLHSKTTSRMVASKMSLKGKRHSLLIQTLTVFVYFYTFCSVATGNVDEFMKSFPKAWNLQDVTVQPGQAFIYKLPPGEKEYLVSESSLDFLPEWLEFDSSARELRGVPRRENLGRSYFFQIEVAGNPSLADYFRLEIKEYDRAEDGKDSPEEMNLTGAEKEDPQLRHHHHHNQVQQQKTIKCKKSKSRTMASVILDFSLDDPAFPVSARLDVMKSFSRFYDIPLEALRLASSSEIGDGAPFDDSALVAGPGDVKPDPKSRGLASNDNDSHAVLSWTVGCGSVQKQQMSVLQRVEKEAVDGTLRRALGRGLVGWYVTNQKPKEERHRRYLKSGHYPTPTPTVSAVPPTAASSYPPPKVIFPIEETTEVEPLVTAALPVTPASVATTAAEQRPVSKTTKLKSKSQKKKTTPGFQEGLFTSPFHEFASAKSFDLIEVQTGEAFLMEITPDFFTAPTVRLEILTVGGIQLNDDSWIKLSAGPPPLMYGVPLLIHEGLQDYVLWGSDAAGSVSRMTIRFKVVRTVEPPFFEANMIFRNIDFDEFNRDVDLRMDLARRIASGFGDRPASDVLVTKLGKGSLDYWWTNRTLSSKEDQTCPEDQVRRIQEAVVDPLSLRVEAEFLDNVEDFGLRFVEFHPRGQCQQTGLTGLRAKYVGDEVAERERVAVDAKPAFGTTVYRYAVDGTEEEDDDDDDEEGNTEKEHSEGGTVGSPAVESSQEVELLKQIAIPVLIVAALLLLSVVVACLVCRRREKRPESSDSTELVGKGAPVIFAHELEDAPPTSSPRALVPAGGGRSPRPPNYHRRAPPAAVGGGSGYPGDFYDTEGLMSGQGRYVSS